MYQIIKLEWCTDLNFIVFGQVVLLKEYASFAYIV
jgi:hypothetical protein